MKKIEHFTRDLGSSWDKQLEKLAAEPGVIWELTAGEDYPAGHETRIAGRIYMWARKHDMKARTSTPRESGTIEVQFTRNSDQPDRRRASEA